MADDGSSAGSGGGPGGEVARRTGSDREDAPIGPGAGGLFGALTAAETAVAVAAEPLLVAPALGFARAGRFAVARALGSVACSGLGPTHLAVDCNLPPETTDEQFERFWLAVDAVARDRDAAVVTGHTGRYEGCGYPAVGAVTALAVGEPGGLLRPDGARPGDRVLLTRGPAVGTTGLLGTCLAVDLAAARGAAVADAAGDRLAEADHAPDAQAAAAAGPVTALADATEGGVVGGLRRMARAGGVRIEVETERVPVAPGVEETCAWAGLDHWTASSQGTLLATVDPAGVDDVLAAFDRRDVPTAVAGQVVEGAGLSVDGTERSDPEGPSVWQVLAERGSRA